MLQDTVSLVKADGQRIDGIKASVQSDVIFIDGDTLPAQEGDIITRSLPNGVIELYLITDIGFKSRMGSMAPHFQMKVQKQTSYDSLKSTATSAKSLNEYVDKARIDELRAIKSEEFDLTKLVALCEELNRCYGSQCLFALALLTRAVLDHLPPVFGYKSFAEVANNYKGTRSFSQSMQHLDTSSRKIADAHLHTQIRSKEALPSMVQVNFKNDLDVLLSEIVRLLK